MASGDTLLLFTPLHNEPPSANQATIDTRNQHPVLDFDGSAPNEEAVFTGIMPRNYSGDVGVTVYHHYSMSSATTGDIDWDGAFERIGDQQQDIDSDGFASPQSTDNTNVPSTSGLVDIVAIPFTDGAQIDGILVGETFRYKATRDATNDTAAGDAELVTVEIKET